MQSSGAQHQEQPDPGPVDFSVLAEQTFGDAELAREVLNIFLLQARECVPQLTRLPAQAQDELAHRLKGSCQGIGAHVAERAAQAFEDAEPSKRPEAHARLATAFAEAERAIVAQLASSLLFAERLG